MEVDALSVGEAGKGLEEKRLIEGLRPGWVAIALPPRRGPPGDSPSRCRRAAGLPAAGTHLRLALRDRSVTNFVGLLTYFLVVKTSKKTRKA